MPNRPDTYIIHGPLRGATTKIGYSWHRKTPAVKKGEGADTLLILCLTGHISLRQNSTIKSHDSGKGGYFCKCDSKSINLQLTRGVPLVGQLHLYLLYDFNSLFSEFTKGIIALPVGQI